ncbi:hypothetical protein GCM10023168_20770 [Fodinibacter luteus]|uniref:RDD family protein n=1 Tax=Fodinibacter luteus TaxID=552064 RepID=A0ABP8KFT6_9MICO
MPTPADRRMPSGPPARSSGPAAAPQTPTFLRRLGALLIDWVICQLLALGLVGGDTAGSVAAFAPLGIFALLNIVLVGLTGSTVGHRLLGLQVWQVRPGAFPLQVVVRTALLCLFVPAVLTGRDGRGLHDVAAGTRIVRL